MLLVRKPRFALPTDPFDLQFYLRVLRDPVGDEFLAPVRVPLVNRIRQNPSAELYGFHRFSVHRDPLSGQSDVLHVFQPRARTNSRQRTKMPLERLAAVTSTTILKSRSALVT